jgi:uncharacterized repeat protein (TIGR01451 family)
MSAFRTATRSNSARGRRAAFLLALILPLPAAMAQQSFDKLGAYAEMRSIAAELDALRAAPDADGSAARSSALQTRFGELQASMGGDDPTRMYEAAASSVPAGGNAPTAPAVAPPPPLGDTITSTTFTQATPVAIPTGPAVVTSTVVVSGAQPYLWDVDLNTTLDHTFAADLDITIASPAGTVVTLTTDNGAGNDNVFNGTLWDDQANPAGQVPYVTNNGVTTDNAYVNLTAATPLAPEESLAAFKGENPNGTWTITISDDLAGDGGNLTTWSVVTHTLPAAPVETTNTFTQATPVAIPTGPAVVTSTIVVAGQGTTISNLRLNPASLTHTFSADLDVTLQGPTGIVVTLSTDNGAGNDNVFNGTVWDNDANPAGQVPYATNNGVTTDNAYVNLTTATPLTAEESLGAFLGTNPNGTWTLTVSDDLAGDGGSIDAWALAVTTGTGCAITCPANVTQGNDPNQCGAVIAYPAPTASAGCGVVTCAPAAGSFFPVGTTTTTCTTAAGPTCTFTATVNDTQPPTITCPANVSAAATAATGAVITFAAPTVTDNCPGIAATVCAPVSGSTFPIGTTTDTCTVADAVANTATCSFTGTVVSPDLAITKTSSFIGTPTVGQTVVFTLTVNNTSTVGATGVSVTDTLPGSLAYVSNTCGATAAGQAVTWNVGTVAAGGTSSCQITTTVSGQGAISNTAAVTSTTFDNNPGNNSGTVSLGSALAAVIPTLSIGGLVLLAALMLIIGYRRRARRTI